MRRACRRLWWFCELKTKIVCVNDRLPFAVIVFLSQFGSNFNQLKRRIWRNREESRITWNIFALWPLQLSAVGYKLEVDRTEKLTEMDQHHSSSSVMLSIAQMFNVCTLYTQSSHDDIAMRNFSWMNTPKKLIKSWQFDSSHMLWLMLMDAVQIVKEDRKKVLSFAPMIEQLM